MTEERVNTLGLPMIAVITLPPTKTLYVSIEARAGRDQPNLAADRALTASPNRRRQTPLISPQHPGHVFPFAARDARGYFGRGRNIRAAVHMPRVWRGLLRRAYLRIMKRRWHNGAPALFRRLCQQHI